VPLSILLTITIDGCKAGYGGRVDVPVAEGDGVMICISHFAVRVPENLVAHLWGPQIRAQYSDSNGGQAKGSD
jgi:hypothetical protein